MYSNLSQGTVSWWGHKENNLMLHVLSKLSTVLTETAVTGISQNILSSETATKTTQGRAGWCRVETARVL